MRAGVFFAAIVLAIPAGRGRAEETAALDEQAIRAQGKEVIAAAAQTLSTNLMKAITNGGFTNAISFCSVHALPLTEAASTNRDGAVLRRISLKLRNPANAPDQIDRRVLENYIGQLAAGAQLIPAIEPLRGETRYYEPIVIQNPVCLNCHGQPGAEVKRETMDLLRKTYPQDAATGYKMNELRGAWSVTFKQPIPGSRRP